MRRSIRTVFVCLLVAMMSFQPAAACNSCNGWGGGYYAPVYYGPVVYGGGCCDCGYETVVYDGCDNCGSCGECEGVVTEGPREETLQAPATTSPTTAAPKSGEQPMPTQPAQPPQAGPAETTPAPQLSTPPAPAQPAPTEPAKPAEPAGSLFGTEPTTTPPATTTPALQKPADDFFTPTEKPAAATPPAPTTPTTPPAGATPPAGPAPSAGTTPPAAAPADELFAPVEKTDTKSGGKTTTTQKPAEKPAATDTKPAEKPVEKPAATPAGAEKNKPEDKKKTEEKDPLFGASPRVLHEAGGLASGEMRQWTDNTGNFSCRGRLVRFLDGQVRLLKENGRTTTVSLARLSAGDLEFVNRQASAQQAEVGKTAQTPATMPMLAN